MGSSGGGGSSGAVSHSAYLEAIHSNWLSDSGVDTLEKSVTEVMDSALGNSPWAGKFSYDPDADIAVYEAEAAALRLLLDNLSDTADWASLYAQADTTLAGPGEAAIAADVAAYGAVLDVDLNTKILPRFRRGMQNINAVVSSSYVLGLAVIEGFRDMEIAKYNAALRLDANARKLTATDMMVQMAGRRVSWNTEYLKTLIEACRIKIVAKKEETDRNATIEDADAKWDLGVFQYGSNLLAAIGGGTSVPYAPGNNSTASTIGGALAVIGAAAQIYNSI